MSCWLLKCHFKGTMELRLNNKVLKAQLVASETICHTSCCFFPFLLQYDQTHVRWHVHHKTEENTYNCKIT